MDETDNDERRDRMQNPRYFLYLEQLSRRDWTITQIAIIAGSCLILYWSISANHKLAKGILLVGTIIFYVSLAAMLLGYLLPGAAH
jgi:hypothetical protein